ncbi:MAG: hypothetical protein F6J86_06265 [Symploca sp. SIO1B1]|nr:hypothetical protein [Symploca sp. SIO1B1]
MVSDLEKTTTTKTFDTEVDRILEQFGGQFQEIADRPHRLIKQILLQTKGQPLLIQELCKHITARGYIPAGEEEKQVKQLLQNHVVTELRFYLEKLQPVETPPPKHRLETRKKSSQSPAQNTVIHNQGKKKEGSVRIIFFMVALIVVNAAIVIASPYIGILCGMVGNCESYKRKLEEAKVKLDEAQILEPQDQDQLEGQRAQIEQAIEPLSKIPKNAQVYPQVEYVQQLAQKEIKIRQAKIFIEEANKAHLDALQEIDKSEDITIKQSVEKKCKFIEQAEIFWTTAMEKEQEAINKVGELEQVEGLVQYSQTLNKQNLANYQSLKEDAASQFSNILQCRLGGDPIWNKQNQSPD